MQARFAIVRHPARLWSQEVIKTIMKACIILHNMIVEDERGQDLDFDYSTSKTHTADEIPPNAEVDMAAEFNAFMNRYVEIRNEEVHDRLQADLMKHLWNRHRDQ